MKKAQETPKKIGRPVGRKPLLALRIDKSLYDRLQETATQTGRTLAEVAVHRLARTFLEEDAYRGREMQRLALAMASTFAFCGEREAAAVGHTDAPAKEWLADQACYRAAFLGLVDLLLKQAPDQSVEAMQVVRIALENSVYSALVASGRLKFDFGDGHGPVGSGFIPPKENTP